MTHRHAFEAVDRTLRDIMHASCHPSAHLPFGGKVIVFGGDFRQILPVVRKGDKAAIMGAAMKNSPLWPHVRTMKLRINMRVQRLSGMNFTADARAPSILRSLAFVG